MSNTKTTKRALLSSAVAMLVCVTMLIGSTYAWFNDSVTSSGNKIQAGTLNIDLLVKKNQNEYASVKDSQAAIFNYEKWEPGYTEVRNVMVKTTGNLALKYTMKIVPNSATEDALKLAEVIDVYYANTEVTTDRNLSGLTKIGTLKDVFTGAAGTIINDTLIPDRGNTEDYATIVLKMQESAGNDYQGLSVGNGFDLQVLATQYTYEEDSFDDQYDATAEYPEVVATADDFEAALDNPDVTEIIVASDITFDWGGNSYGNSNALKMQDKVISGATGNEVVTFKGYGSANPIKDVTISNINVVDETVGDSTGWEHAYLEFENLTATDVKFVNAPQLNGNCILTNCTFTGTADKYAAWINSGNITLKNCMFNGIRSLKIHEAYGSDVVSVVVDGCTFNTTGKPGVVIGDLDATTSITIKNSTFNNCAAGDLNKYIYESDTDVITFNFTEIDNTVNNG